MRAQRREAVEMCRLRRRLIAPPINSHCAATEVAYASCLCVRKCLCANRLRRASQAMETPDCGSRETSIQSRFCLVAIEEAPRTVAMIRCVISGTKGPQLFSTRLLATTICLVLRRFSHRGSNYLQYHHEVAGRAIESRCCLE